MRTHVVTLVTAILVAILSVGSGCSPERTVLSSTPFDAPAPCDRHESCSIGQLCVTSTNGPGRVCASCTEQKLPDECDQPCAPGWLRSPSIINQCDVCVCKPSNACTTDLDCASGLRCYSGQDCPANCAGSPRCCFGNICALPGCTDTVGVECGLVGCQDKSNAKDGAKTTCSATCRPSCMCDAATGTWSCTGGCGAVCE